MIDTLVRLLPLATQAKKKGLPRQYALVTLHRPANVDDPQMLRKILISMLALNRDLPVIFPVHPRTRQAIRQFGLEPDGIRMTDPFSYLEFHALHCRAS